MRKPIISNFSHLSGAITPVQTEAKPPFFFNSTYILLERRRGRVRGAVVEWLEQLGYGAESRRIARVRGSAAPCGDWKTLSVNPAENGYLFRIREG